MVVFLLPLQSSTGEDVTKLLLLNLFPCVVAAFVVLMVVDSWNFSANLYIWFPKSCEYWCTFAVTTRYLPTVLCLQYSLMYIGKIQGYILTNFYLFLMSFRYQQLFLVFTMSLAFYTFYSYIPSLHLCITLPWSPFPETRISSNKIMLVKSSILACWTSGTRELHTRHLLIACTKCPPLCGSQLHMHSSVKKRFLLHNIVSTRIQNNTLICFFPFAATSPLNATVSKKFFLNLFAWNPTCTCTGYFEYFIMDKV